MSNEKIKKEILRKCIVTNKIINIDEMIRFGKDKENNIFLDKEKNNQGRGAYVIKNSELIKTALDKKTLNRTFKSNISNEIYNRLKQEVKIYEEKKDN